MLQLDVEDTSQMGAVVWSIAGRPAAITPPLSYGEVPSSADERIPPGPLVSGTVYRVELLCGVPPRDLKIVGRDSFTATGGGGVTPAPRAGG